MKKGEMLSNMLVLATNAHHDQYDKGGNPYILHPLKVMYLCKTNDEELQCIALGHDVIEDTNVTYDDLRTAGMSERVIKGIKSMTKERGETFEEYKVKIKSNPDAIIVKMADLRHNTDVRRLKGVTEKDVQRMVKYHNFYLELQEIRENS